MEKITSNNFRSSKELKLPASGLTIEIYTALLVGEIATIDTSKSEMEVGIQTLAKLIKSWNFYENQESEKSLPVTYENICKLPVVDLEFLSQEVKVLTAAQKKSS